MNIKPTVLHNLTGAHKKNPNRARSNEAQPRMGIGESPKHPSVDFADVWGEVVDSVCPGVLGNSDRLHLEIVCHLICQFRLNPEETSAAKVLIIEKMLGKLGMNPIDRIRIVIPEEQEQAKEYAYFN
jgi:hypothetical protein